MDVDIYTYENFSLCVLKKSKIRVIQAEWPFYTGLKNRGYADKIGSTHRQLVSVNCLFQIVYLYFTPHLLQLIILTCYSNVISGVNRPLMGTPSNFLNFLNIKINNLDNQTNFLQRMQRLWCVFSCPRPSISFPLETNNYNIRFHILNQKNYSRCPKNIVQFLEN